MLALVIVLCWRRFDGNRREEDVKRQLAEIERIKTQRLNTLRDKGFIQKPEYPTWDQHGSSLPLSQISQTRTVGYSNQIVGDNPFAHLQIEGMSRTRTTPSYHQRPIEITRKSSMSRSKTYTRPSQWTTGGPDASPRGELSFVNLPSGELSYRSKTADEMAVLRRRMKHRRRSSLSSRQIQRARRELQEKERMRKVETESSESSDSESEDSEDLNVTSGKVSIDDQISQGVKSLWSKGQSTAFLSDVWSDDGQGLSPHARSLSIGASTRRTDSIVVLGPEENLQPAGDEKLNLDELRKWRRELSRNTMSHKSLNIADETSNKRNKIHRSTPSITRSETVGNRKEVSSKEVSLYVVP